MITAEWVGAMRGHSVSDLLHVAGERVEVGDLGKKRSSLLLADSDEPSDRGRVNVVRERIVGAICRSAFGFGIEELESHFSDLLAVNPALAKAVWRIYDKTTYCSGIHLSGRCSDPHESAFREVIGTG